MCLCCWNLFKLECICQVYYPQTKKNNTFILKWQDTRTYCTFHVSCVSKICILIVLINRPNYQATVRDVTHAFFSKVEALMPWIWHKPADTHMLMEKFTPPHADTVMTGQIVHKLPVSSYQIWQIQWFCACTSYSYFQVKNLTVRGDISWNLCQVFCFEIQLIPSKNERLFFFKNESSLMFWSQ